MRRLTLTLGALCLVLGPALALRAQSRIENPHGNLRLDCAQCHTPERWVPVDRPQGFRHETTGFALESAHGKTSCRSCHRSLVFDRVGTACADCHRDSHRGEMGARCEVCHTPTSWTNQGQMFRVHNRTRFPIMAVHARLDCAACHRGQAPYQYANTPAECGNCHLATYQQTTSPNHVQSGFSRRCEDCHKTTATSWHQATFIHPATFPLAGGHGGVVCARCHTPGVATPPSAECISCHRKDYVATTNPNHPGGGIPTTCQDCHTTITWRPAKFDHDKTAFPLTGAHLRTDCSRCHVGSSYKGTPTDCYACHKADYASTTSPNHGAAGIPTQCQNCHNTGAWRPANFDHNKTIFPLTGTHQKTECAKCHIGGRYKGTPSDCYTCHQANYAATVNPNHIASSLPKTCLTCHNTVAWRPASIDHNATRFPLTGTHTKVDCAKCHVGGRYTGTPTDCYSCHQAKYVATTNPNHVASQLPKTCQNCHNTSAWRPAIIDHNATRFPLTGAHTKVDCSKCHVGGRYTGTPTDCYSCHQAKYAATTNPNHVASAFPKTCQSCHNTSAWRPAIIDHNATRFPLTGAHTKVDCAKCHVGGRYTGTPTDCYSCHQANYAATTNPNHVASAFPKTCQNCHNTAAWRPATIDHNTTRFPLTGAHTKVACAQCHVGGRYTGTPTDCYSCHQPNYAGTTNPNHGAAGFPTQCQNCHTTTAWKPANWDHDGQYFPIYSGKHRGQWTTCGDCHINAANYRLFECILCHKHSNKTQVDSNHKGVNGYSYSSTACYGCHHNGRAGSFGAVRRLP